MFCIGPYLSVNVSAKAKLVSHTARVSVQTLMDYLEAGDFIDQYRGGFPTVTRAPFVVFLARAATLAVTEARPFAVSRSVLTGRGRSAGGHG